MDTAEWLFRAFEQMGLSRDRARKMLRIEDDLSGFSYREPPIESTAAPRQEFITNGRLTPGPVIRVQGGQWLVETTVRSSDTGKRNRTIDRIWVVQNTPLRDLIGAIAKVKYNDPAADVEFLQALRDKRCAELWIASRFETSRSFRSSPETGPFRFRLRNSLEQSSGQGTELTPKTIRELFRVHGLGWLDSWRDSDKLEAMNFAGHIEFAVNGCLGELHIRRSGDRLHLHLPDGTDVTVTRAEFETMPFPGTSISSLRWMHGDEFARRVFRAALE